MKFSSVVRVAFLVPNILLGMLVSDEGAWDAPYLLYFNIIPLQNGIYIDALISTSYTGLQQHDVNSISTLAYGHKRKLCLMKIAVK